jgi:chitinase
LINPELPYIHKKAVEILKADYPNREAAGLQIVEEIENYYRTTYPEVYNGKGAPVGQSADNVAKIYLRNVFRDMSVNTDAQYAFTCAIPGHFFKNHDGVLKVD